MYYSHPSMEPIFAGRNYKGSSYLRFDDPWIHFGYKSILNLNYEPKDSPWRITSSKEEFYVAIELRSNPDRTESDFEIHVFDVDTFLPVFSNSISRILPIMRCTAKNKNEEIIFEREIIEPKYLLGNNKDKAVTRHWNMKHGSKLMYSVNDPLSSKSVGICKAKMELLSLSHLSSFVAVVILVQLLQHRLGRPTNFTFQISRSWK